MPYWSQAALAAADPTSPSYSASAPVGAGDGITAATGTPLDTQWTVTRVGQQTQVTPERPINVTIQNPMRPTISWPGARSIISLTYTNSHSTQPGTAILTINPQDQPPETFGDLIFSDGIRKPVVLKDCHVDAMTPEIGPGGARIHMQISDRRWRWVQGYEIDGEYNRMDTHGNLVPWTVRSATELAKLCLERMGEKKAVIAFPPGLMRQQADKYDRALRAGERFPLTFANPYVNWDHIPAAQALQELAGLFGCRVMYDPISDEVRIWPQGYGDKLAFNGYSIRQASQGIKADRMPKYVGVLGAPIKFQMRISLEAVGEEYDGFYTTIDKLSYAPILAAATKTKEATRGWDYSCPPYFDEVEGTARFEYTEARQQAKKCVFRAYRVRENDKNGKFNRGGIDVNGKGPITVPGLRDKLVTGPDPATEPPTDAVFKNYFKSQLDFRQQVILTGDMVEQVKPESRLDADIVVDPNRPAAQQGALPDYYNGYSRDKPSHCYGTYWHGCSRMLFALPTGNNNDVTDIVTNRRIYLQSQVEPTEQLVTFEQAIYVLENPTTKMQAPVNARAYRPCKDLFIETGVHILDPETNAPYRCRYWIELGGDAPPVWEIREDVITHIVGIYAYDFATQKSTSTGKDVGANVTFEAKNKLSNYRIDDFGDGKKRASYYLQGMKRRYQNWETQNVVFNGALRISPTGVVQQIQWSLGGDGITTTVGVNTEFSPSVPPYPARKLQENLPPDQMGRILNEASSPRRASEMAKAAKS